MMEHNSTHDRRPFPPEAGIKPNFFIVGAPKCGTTSMANYLASHPDIFMSNPKEPHYFCTDLLRGVSSLSEYLSLFPDDNPPQVVGEASTWYLSSEVAARLIFEFNPSARILVMIRNPVELVHSLHSQLLFNQVESVNDFEKAWRLQDARMEGDFRLQYRRMGALGSQIDRLLTVFPCEQVEIVLFDEFVDSTKSVYENVLGFLGLESDGRTEFPVMNQSKALRSSRLARFVRETPAPLKWLATKVKRLLSVDELGILATVQSLNIRRYERPPLRPEFRRELTRAFRSEIVKLEKILDQDLSPWKEQSDSAG